MKVEQKCGIISRTMLNDAAISLTLEAGDMVRTAFRAPGQFVHIKCGHSRLLRRPISVCSCQEDVPNDLIAIAFEVRGDGTRWLAQRKVGDTLDVMGLLGNGFSIKPKGRYLLVGGGIGVPPMLGCVREAVKQGSKPAAILGFRNQGAVILEGDFRDECETFVTTDDGSYARHGFVTDVLKEQIASASGVAACGPKPMLKAIAAIAKEAGVPCQVSMEERMGCGIGACLVCACALKAKDGETRYGHVCKDGPVFNAEEVEW